MWNIINEIRRRGQMNGYEASRYSIYTLGRAKKSVGGCLARAIQHGHIEIIGTTFVNGREVNIYE